MVRVQGPRQILVARGQRQGIAERRVELPGPISGFIEITGYLAFYASRVDECWVDNERVIPQEGYFYGGWITSRIVGPFKGGPQTRGW